MWYLYGPYRPGDAEVVARASFDLSDLKPDSPEQRREDFADYLNDRFWMGGRYIRLGRDLRLPDWVVTLAKNGNGDAWAACMETAAKKIETCGMFEGLAKLAATVLREQAAEPPRGRGRTVQLKNESRDTAITTAIDYIVAFCGLEPTRGATARELDTHDSASSIVRRVLPDYGFSLGEVAINAIWQKEMKLRVQYIAEAQALALEKPS